MAEPRTPLIIALDFPEPAEALNLVRKLDPASCRLKIGKELFTRGGPAVVEEVIGLGFEFFFSSRRRHTS